MNGTGLPAGSPDPAEYDAQHEYQYGQSAEYIPPDISHTYGRADTGQYKSPFGSPEIR